MGKLFGCFERLKIKTSAGSLQLFNNSYSHSWEARDEINHKSFQRTSRHASAATWIAMQGTRTSLEMRRRSVDAQFLTIFPRFTQVPRLFYG
jgi:hypothetical protein